MVSLALQEPYVHAGRRFPTPALQHQTLRFFLLFLFRPRDRRQKALLHVTFIPNIGYSCNNAAVWL